MILDPMNAPFKDDWLIHNDVPEDMIEQVTVGVDPSGGDDEVGIVASALLHDGRFAVLADRRPRLGALGSGARPWCVAMMTSMPTTLLWSKSTSWRHGDRSSQAGR